MKTERRIDEAKIYKSEQKCFLSFNRFFDAYSVTSAHKRENLIEKRQWKKHKIKKVKIIKKSETEN